MFIPRHPVVENQFCSFTTTSGTSGAGGVLAYAGSVCYLVETATNQEAEVQIYKDTAPTDTDERVPFGFLMQKVKEGYHAIHPTGFYMPGDLGSSDAIAQPTYSTAGAINGTQAVPVAVAHLGIWDTVHYGTDAATTAIKPGQRLYVDAGASTVATYSRVTNGTALTNVTTVVARVVKGVSGAKADANIANTAQYPIRIKLMI
jgi:hypothetical protein